MIKKLIRLKNGEGYIDTAVSMVAFVMILVIAINVFSFITLKQEMDQIAEELICAATYSGAFDDDFRNRESELQKQYFFDTQTSAESFYNTTYQRVQLGDTMSITISESTYVKGLGIFKIPVTLSVTRSGISEKYWK